MKWLLTIGLIGLVILFSFAGIGAARSDNIEGHEVHATWHLKPAAATSVPTGLVPAQVIKAYNLLSSGGGAGTTIAIIDAYDNPNAQADLDAFSKQSGLPLTTDGKFTFNKVKIGSVPGDTGWGLEIALDIQWAHAIAPNANILLVEAASSGLGDLLGAVNYAKSQPNVVAISMSWGAGEWFFESYYDSYFNSSHGEVYFAASGDSGGAVIWPSVVPNVVAVGGTTLNVDSSGNLGSETGWSGSGGGLSNYESEPSYQSTYGIPGANGMRGVPDVSYDADPYTGFSVLDNYGYGGWLVVGGTSAGAPQWAAIQALGLTSSNSNFYKDAKSSSYTSYFRDITIGSAGKNSATTSYDYVTGLGSPTTTNFAPVTAPDFSIAASPSSITAKRGDSPTSIITLTSVSGFNSAVSLSVSAPGLVATVNPTSVTPPVGGSASSMLTINVPSTTTPGTYTIKVTGISGSLSHSTSLAVSVVVPDFSIMASNPSTQAVYRTGIAAYTIVLTALNGYSSPVKLSVTTALPSGWTASFAPSAVTPTPTGSTSMLTVTVGQRHLGIYTFTITGTGTGGITHSTKVTLYNR